MRVFSNYVNESCVTADINPGNNYPDTGVTNHLTPVGNIVTQIRNLWGPVTGVVASVGEDGFSVKLNSSKFTSEEEVNNLINDYTYFRNTSISAYIQQQGLNIVKIIPVGQFFVVYFCPNDIKAANKNPKEDVPTCAPCKEMLDNNLDEVEMLSIVKESDDEEEMEDLEKKKIEELISSKDKVKAAKQFELLVGQKIELPREYYFAGVKDKDGQESIALRWKYQKARPHNNTTEMTRSLINIYDMSDEGIWVQDFVEDTMFQLPDEVKTLIENILEFLGASKTKNPAVWSLAGGPDKDKDKDEDNDEDKDETSDDDSNDKDSSKENKEDKEDQEDKDKDKEDDDNLL